MDIKKETIQMYDKFCNLIYPDFKHKFFLLFVYFYEIP
jgi:hypothetical protein